MKKKIISLLIFLTFNISNVCAHDDVKIHSEITGIAAKNSTLDAYLNNNLNLTNGVNTKLPPNGGKYILDLLKDGSTAEDHPMCRASNHFHDPMNTKSWTSAATSDSPWWIDTYCIFWSTYYSDVTWATGFTDPASSPIPYNPENEKSPNMWANARTLYFNALTSINDASRENNSAKMFLALGQALHLLQDMSVPAHVRNDFKSHLIFNGFCDNEKCHYFNIIKWFGNPFEYYIKMHPTLVNAAGAANVPPTFTNPRLTDFWDTNQYNGTSPSMSTTSGLAEITNANYFSNNTVPNNKPSTEHIYPFPALNFNSYHLCEHNEMGTTTLRKYICRNNAGNLFDAISLLNEEASITNDNISTLKMVLDDNVHDTYAKELLPLAIGYSSSLLNYFFRGSLEISLPGSEVYSVTTADDGFDKITLAVKNNSVSTDEMTDGEIYLVLKYKVAQSDPFQSVPVPVSSDFTYRVIPEKNNIRAIPRTPVNLTFDLSSQKMPLWATDVYLQVVYKGKMGAEDNAIAVGFKDISEPTPMDFINIPNTCYHGTWVASGSDAAVTMADTNGDGIADSDIYPHLFKDMYVKISSPGASENSMTATVDHYTYKAASVATGQYSRAYILSDEEFVFHSRLQWVPVDSRDTYPELEDVLDYYITFNTVTNQTEHESTQTCCEITGVPSCGTDYSNPNCCERLYEAGCNVRYYSEFEKYMDIYRWAMLRGYMRIGTMDCEF